MPRHDLDGLTEREFHELKVEAANYYENNKVPEKVEEILNSMFYEKPADVYGRLSTFFETMAVPAKLSNLTASQTMDSTGNIALKCDVQCIVRNELKKLSSTSMLVSPEIAITPLPAADTDQKEVTKENVVTSSIQIIHEILSNKLKDNYVTDQKELDSISRKWIDSQEKGSRSSSRQSALEGEEIERTPTPSSGRKKKAPSAKPKPGKAPEKPVPPFEPLEKRTQGCTAVALVSVGLLKAASSFVEESVYHHLHKSMQVRENLTLPVPSMSLISGGKATAGKLNIAKNVFAIAKPGLRMEESLKKLTQIYQQMATILSAKGSGSKTKSNAPPKLLPPPPVGLTGGFQPNYEKLEQPLDLITEAITALGMTTGHDIFFGIECAAHEIFDYDKGKYEIMTGGLKSADEIVEYYRDIVARYPAIIALVDPIRKEDKEQWTKLCDILSEKCYLLGSDAVYGSMHAVTPSHLEERATSGVVLNVGGRQTITDMATVIKNAQDIEAVSILTSPPGDVCDPVFSDLAVGLNVDIVRVGAPSRGENVERINRLNEIENELKTKERKFQYHDKFKFRVIKPPPPPAVIEDDVTSNMTSSSLDHKSKKK